MDIKRCFARLHHAAAGLRHACRVLRVQKGFDIRARRRRTKAHINGTREPALKHGLSLEHILRCDLSPDFGWEWNL